MTEEDDLATVAGHQHRPLLSQCQINDQKVIYQKGDGDEYRYFVPSSTFQVISTLPCDSPAELYGT